MRRKGGRWVVGFAGAAMLGALYQTACMGFASDQLQGSIDFCFLFDCQNGAFGGLVNFCPDNVSTSSGTDTALTNGNTFVDCPVISDN